MKKELHPQIYKDAKATCTACGAVFTIPSTVKVIQIEICSNCHPVYTGKYRAVTASGRVDRFQKKRKQAAAHEKEMKARPKKKVLTPEEKFLKRAQEKKAEKDKLKAIKEREKTAKKIAEAKKTIVKGGVGKESKEGKVGTKKIKKTTGKKKTLKKKTVKAKKKAK